MLQGQNFEKKTWQQAGAVSSKFTGLQLHIETFWLNMCVSTIKKCFEINKLIHTLLQVKQF